MLLLLRYGVLLSSLFAIISLSVLIFKTISFGKKSLYAELRDDGKNGVFYALGKGMMPWEKESAAKHLPTFFAGLGYHTGVFSALAYLFLVFFLRQFSLPVLSLFRFLFILGSLCGCALLAKRIISPIMRKISCSDDFAANIIVTLFIIAALVQSFNVKFAPFFFGSAILMFLYAPLGKIRHCFFFFYTRILFGLFYGRRGVFPPKTHKV